MNLPEPYKNPELRTHKLCSAHHYSELVMGRASGRALKARPARPIFARPGPPEARSKKPESPGAFFGLKIGQFSTDFQPNLGKIMGHFVTKNFSFVLGQKSAENRPILGPFLADLWPSPKFKNFN